MSHSVLSPLSRVLLVTEYTYHSKLIYNNSNKQLPDAVFDGLDKYVKRFLTLSAMLP